MRSLEWIFAVIVCAGLSLGANAAKALECVPFARDVSGIGLRGDAWRWWDEAAGHYDRGKTPKEGSVAVFMKRAFMSHGHVAVVHRVIDRRHVLVDHANWAPNRSHKRGSVSRMVAVEDVSPHNDWTEVRVWNQESRDFGTRTYPVYGFIYARHAAARSQQTIADRLGQDIVIPPSDADNIFDSKLSTAAIENGIAEASMSAQHVESPIGSGS